MKIQSKANITAFIKLCAHGCKRCGKEKEFTCCSTIPKSLKNGKASDRYTIVILCALGGLIFFIIFAMILRFKYSKTHKSCNPDNGRIRPRRNAKSLARLLMQKEEDYVEDNDPTYGEIDETFFSHKDAYLPVSSCNKQLLSIDPNVMKDLIKIEDNRFSQYIVFPSR